LQPALPPLSTLQRGMVGTQMHTTLLYFVFTSTYFALPFHSEKVELLGQGMIEMYNLEHHCRIRLLHHDPEENLESPPAAHGHRTVNSWQDQRPSVRSFRVTLFPMIMKLKTQVNPLELASGRTGPMRSHLRDGPGKGESQLGPSVPSVEIKARLSYTSNVGRMNE
jgi:hypothetical protein